MSNLSTNPHFRLRMSSRILYIHKRAAPEAFQQTISAFVTAGWLISSAPLRNRDGYTAGLKSKEEIWIEWYETDTLVISAVSEPGTSLKSEIQQVIAGITISEVPAI